MEEHKHFGIIFGIFIGILLVLNGTIIFLSWKSHADGTAPLADMFMEMERAFDHAKQQSANFYQSEPVQKTLKNVKDVYLLGDFSVRETIRQVYISVKDTTLTLSRIFYSH